jgi:Uma2 family endonuclease
MEAVALSAYEIERDKPMPNLIHGVLQSKINGLLLKYQDKYMFPSELSLATIPSSYPDICIYPRKKLSLLNAAPKETEPPITTIEIQSPSQSVDELLNKAWNLYFPMGVQSAWIVIPAIKGIQIFLPDSKKLLFISGMLKDPVTNIEIEVEPVFEDLE